MVKKSMLVLALLGLVFAPVFAQGLGNGKGNGRGGKGGWGSGAKFDNGMGTLLNSLPEEELSPQEKASLIQIREEEKLAHDIYYKLYEVWELQVFRNIARSELRHMNAVRVLIQKYGLNDPVVENNQGIFTNPELQALYNELTAKGSLSLQDALEVGAIVEDLDIYDLLQFLKTADNQDVKILYQNLAKGSRNHLRAFVGQLLRFQFQYQARYLTQKEVDDILASPMERGLIDEDGKPYFGDTGW